MPPACPAALLSPTEMRISDPKVPSSGVGLFHSVHDTGGILAENSYFVGRAERTSGYGFLWAFGLPYGVMVYLFTSPDSSCHHCLK